MKQKKHMYDSPLGSIFVVGNTGNIGEPNVCGLCEGLNIDRFVLYIALCEPLDIVLEK